MNSYAYVRVSSRDQNEDRQLRALEKIGIPISNFYIDKQSGKDFNRPRYQKMLEALEENDILYITSIDRLGRNYEEIIEQWKILTKEKKVDIIVLDMPLLDTTKSKDLLGTFISDLVLQILSYCSESERNSIKKRQKEGIEAAKHRGVKFGRPKKILPEEEIECYIDKRRKMEEILNEYNIGKSTFYRKVKEYKKTLS
ncbi:MAG: recombinase family protein [Bacillota bacterium]|nr:recombinase family protein [Bacillota bacterium]